MLEVIGFHFYCICAEVTPPEGWSKLGLSRFALIYTAHQAESSHKIVRNSNTIKHENMKFLLRNISFHTELKLGLQLSKLSIYRLERVGFSRKRRGFSYRNRMWVGGKCINRTGWLPSTVWLRDFIAKSHLSTVLRSFLYNLWAEQWADQRLQEDTDIVSPHAKKKWRER